MVASRKGVRDEKVAPDGPGLPVLLGKVGPVIPLAVSSAASRSSHRTDTVVHRTFLLLRNRGHFYCCLTGGARNP